jgi:hypothetical protein
LGSTLNLLALGTNFLSAILELRLLNFDGGKLTSVSTLVSSTLDFSTRGDTDGLHVIVKGYSVVFLLEFLSLWCLRGFGSDWLGLALELIFLGAPVATTSSAFLFVGAVVLSGAAFAISSTGSTRSSIGAGITTTRILLLDLLGSGLLWSRLSLLLNLSLDDRSLVLVVGQQRSKRIWHDEQSLVVDRPNLESR